MDKQAIKSLLQELLVKEKSIREAHKAEGEGENLSIWLVDYADLLRRLGEYLAEATNLEEQLDDQQKFTKEQQKLHYIEDKVEGKHRTISQAESLAITGPKYREAREKWLEASKVKTYLKIRFEASQNFLDSARSRLSYLGRNM
jgi:hypothetical protein